MHIDSLFRYETVCTPEDPSAQNSFHRSTTRPWAVGMASNRRNWLFIARCRGHGLFIPCRAERFLQLTGILPRFKVLLCSFPSLTFLAPLLSYPSSRMIRFVALATLFGSTLAQQMQLVTNYSGSALYVLPKEIY